MMMGYDSYKNIGLTWLSEIPSHWKLLRLKNLGTLSTSSVDKKIVKGEDIVNLVNYMDVYNSKEKQIHPRIDFMKVSASESKKLTSNLLVGDVLFTPSSETIDDIGHSAVVIEKLENTLFSYHILRLRFDKVIQLNLSFKKYVFNNFFFLNQLSSKARGSTRMTLGLKDFYSSYVLVPEESEQTKIAQFLDHQTGIIDALIEKKEEIIKKLKEQRQAIINEAVTKGLDPNAKMKDSGVEWLGEIPEEWGFVKLRRFVKDHRQGYYSSKDYDESGYKVARITDIKDNNVLELDDSPYYNLDIDEIKNFILEKGDFVFQRTGAHKKIGVYTTDEPAIYGSFLIRFRFDYSHYDREFLLMYFESDLYTNQLNSTIHGGVNPNIHAENIKDCMIVMPSLEIQNNIVAQFQKIRDSFISSQDKLIIQIERLKEYRQSIISEAVTGKIDVREWEPKKN